MPASPADISRFTSDGVLITLQNQAIKDRDPNAADTGDRELEMFFDDPNHGQILADELFSFVAQEGRPHEAVQTDDTLGLGTTIPVFPLAPHFVLQDATRSIDTDSVMRAYSFDMGTDAYAIELVGLRTAPAAPGAPVWDSGNIMFDNGTLTWDREA